MKLDRSRSSIGTVVMYVIASIIGLVAVGLLVDNIIIFKNTVDQYVAQGYPSPQVVQQLMQSQLLPGLFEAIAVYGGISVIIFGIAAINQKISRGLGVEVGAIENGNREPAEDPEQGDDGADQGNGQP
ncbi:MAG: hypothetical protein M0Z41_04490 [Peptococcaceae bacterium]|jgi:hypothetical protein|nr:hypothetical protein [Peptococcaceae bacterium]